MNRTTYFKRLDYELQTIPSSPFSSVSYQSTAKQAVCMPITQFIDGKPHQAIEALFNVAHSGREKHCGLGSAFLEQAYTNRNSGLYLKIVPETSKEIPDFFIRFTLTAEQPALFDHNYIEIADNASARITLYVDTESTAPAPFYRNGLIKIAVGKNATVEILKIQNCADTAVCFETVRMDVHEKAHVQVHDVYIGSEKTGTSYSSHIHGDNADVHITPLYFVDKKRRMDIEHNLIIDGMQTVSEIAARGAVKNEAHKVFRGNIFFNKGCSGSTGRFSDTSIMLDKRVSGVTIPTIFCDEDDVVGEHAASFVAIDKEKLYYLMSRGFDEVNAKKLIVESAFRSVFDSIQDDELKLKLNTEFSERLAAETV